MADEIAWPIERIPDADSVFMRAHKVHVIDGELQAGVFRPQGLGLSVNWSKYSTIKQTRQEARKCPEDNAVISMIVGNIRQIDGLSVQHTPNSENQAHSDIFGIPDQREHLVEIRMQLRRIATCILPVQSSPAAS